MFLTSSFVILPQRTYFVSRKGTNLIPELDVEAEVDVEVLVVVVVEDGVRLPRLPPLPLEGDAGVVEDAVVVRVHEDRAERHCKEEEGSLTHCIVGTPSGTFQRADP